MLQKYTGFHMTVCEQRSSSLDPEKDVLQLRAQMCSVGVGAEQQVHTETEAVVKCLVAPPSFLSTELQAAL